MAKFRKIKFIIRKRALGDVLWIEPVIRELAASGERLIVHTKYNDLFQNFPYPNVIFWDQLNFAQKAWLKIGKKMAGPMFVDLDGAYEEKPELHFLEAYQLKAGLPPKREYPKLYLNEAEVATRADSAPYAVIHFESFSDKPYRNLENFPIQELVQLLHQAGLKVYQATTKGEAVDGAIGLQKPLRELMGCIKNAAVFVGIDSGPSHIAASLHTKSLIFFGALNPGLRHFPDLLNGQAVKQICGNSCQNILRDNDPVQCEFVQGNTTPPCCKYSVEKLRFYLDQVLN